MSHDLIANLRLSANNIYDFILSEFAKGTNDIAPAYDCYSNAILKSGMGSNSFECFQQYDAFASVFLLMVAFAVYSLVWSIVGNNCSKVDQVIINKS